MKGLGPRSRMGSCCNRAGRSASHLSLVPGGLIDSWFCNWAGSQGPSWEQRVPVIRSHLSLGSSLSQLASWNRIFKAFRAFAGSICHILALRVEWERQWSMHLPSCQLKTCFNKLNNGFSLHKPRLWCSQSSTSWGWWGQCALDLVTLHQTP